VVCQKKVDVSSVVGLTTAASSRSAVVNQNTENIPTRGDERAKKKEEWTQNGGENKKVISRPSRCFSLAYIIISNTISTTFHVALNWIEYEETFIS